jgi:hypothetical protein
VTESKAVDSRLASECSDRYVPEAAVGAECVAFSGEHPRRVFALSLEREHLGREGKLAWQVLAAQESQQLAVVGRLGKRDAAHLVA